MKFSTILIGLFFVGIDYANADCPVFTLSESTGISSGQFAQQYELNEFQNIGSCKLTFSENPDISTLNSRVRGNQMLPPLAERLPDEPLVIVPYQDIGKYGGTLHAISSATEALTSDFLSLRHVNFVRFSDDLKTIVPNIAKDWEWNSDFTQLTFYLRKGHKWSDGHPFTAEDVVFWYKNLILDPRVREQPPNYALVNGDPMTVDVIDPQTVRFSLKQPKPGLLIHFASSFAQGFQPKHFLGKFHPDINPDADKFAKELGFENGFELVKLYYGSSDWTDTPTPLLKEPAKVSSLPADVLPTLESHVYISDSVDGRHLVANPYFHIVDTAGQQLPYISEMHEIYVNEYNLITLKLINGEIDYKTQGLQLSDIPLLLDNQATGNYSIDTAPSVQMHTFTFNVTSHDLEKRKLFENISFRKAMSLAIDRNELNEDAYFGLGNPEQYIGFSPVPEFIDDKWVNFNIDFDPTAAQQLLDSIGLTDSDGDGFREVSTGQRLVLNVAFSAQIVPTIVVEKITQSWADVGIATRIRDMTPDEFRSSQSANNHDVGFWEKGQSLATTMGDDQQWVPPFNAYFGLRTGMLWAEFIDSDGTDGIEPPDFVTEMTKDIHALQSVDPATEERNLLARRLVKNMVENQLFSGTVRAVNPIYHNNTIGNFVDFKTASFYYYWAYPYRPYQWFFEKD